MKKLTLFMLLLGTAISTTTYAESPSFTYVEFEYIATGDIQASDGSLSVDVGLDGFALNASVELGIFLLQASRFELETETVLIAPIEDSITTLAAGLTFALPQTSLYGLVRARRDELSLVGGGFDENVTGNTVGFEAGVRFNLTDRIELNANIGKPALDQGSSFGVGAQFFVTDNIGITLDFSSLEVEDEDDDEDDPIRAEFNTTSIGLRYTF